MNIGFDGKRAANNLTGLGNYSRSLIRQLAEFFPQNQYFVYTPQLQEQPQISSFFKKDHILLKLPSKKQFRWLWRSIGIKKQLSEDQIDIYHGLSNEIPLGIQRLPLKTVVTIHDLIFLRLPQTYSITNRTIYNLKARYACKHADRIIAISQQTKNDIIAFYGTDPAKIEVIYQSCDDTFKTLVPEADKAAVRSKYGLPDKYFLYVGTIEARKNLLLIVQAMRSVNPDYKLVVIGRRQAYAKEVDREITASGLTGRVLFLTGIPAADLPCIYQMASIFLYPSFYEGFGIPVIEALYSGVPVIAASGSCLEEAGGPDSIYVGPRDAAAMSAAIRSILDDPERASMMSRRGLLYVQQFNTSSLSRQLMDCYRNMMLKN